VQATTTGRVWSAEYVFQEIEDDDEKRLIDISTLFLNIALVWKRHFFRLNGGM
jgi:hypothetical protein